MLQMLVMTQSIKASTIFILVHPLLPKDLTIEYSFVLTASGVVPRGGRKTFPRILS